MKVYSFDRESDKSIYETSFVKELKDYKILSDFHTQQWSDYPPETKIKILNIVKNCFEQIGFTVN